MASSGFRVVNTTYASRKYLLKIANTNALCTVCLPESVFWFIINVTKHTY